MAARETVALLERVQIPLATLPVQNYKDEKMPFLCRGN